jgi:16S rRNA pseudouridine516 synthase
MHPAAKVWLEPIMSNAAERINVSFKKNYKFIKLDLTTIHCPSILVTHTSPLISIIGPLLEEPKVMAKISTSRVDKLLSSMGYGSRKELARMAKAGGITLDGAEFLDVTKRIPVTPDLPTRMKIDGEAVDPVAGMVILLNKPLGMTCSHKEDGALVYDILPDRWKSRNPTISTIGRLDKQTTGLLLLTDDGDLLHRVISPKRHVKKTYRAKLARPLNGTEHDLFASGQLMLEGEDKPLAPAELEIVSKTEALLSVREGRYHQVRRMFAATGNHVEELHRERLGGLSLPDGMVPGQWKLLSEKDIALIFL